MPAATHRGWWRPALLAVAACAPRAELPDQTRLTVELNRQFTRSAEAWNRGDLEAFLASYAHGGAGDGAVCAVPQWTAQLERSLHPGDGAARYRLENPA